MLAERHGRATIIDFGGDVPSVLGMDDSLRVTVSLAPRASMLATSARWLGVSQHVVGSARFATEFEIAEQ
jgi:hypothetical protein